MPIAELFLSLPERLRPEKTDPPVMLRYLKAFHRKKGL
jgi:hypothetical protein